MNATSMSSRLLSAALAAILSVGLLVGISEQLNPLRLAVAMPVLELEPVVVTAPVQEAAPVAVVRASTAAN